MSAIVATTSGGWILPVVDTYSVRVTGPNNFNFQIVSMNKAEFSKTDRSGAVFAQTIEDGAALNESPTTIVAGTGLADTASPVFLYHR